MNTEEYITHLKKNSKRLNGLYQQKENSGLNNEVNNNFHLFLEGLRRHNALRNRVNCRYSLPFLDELDCEAKVCRSSTTLKKKLSIIILLTSISNNHLPTKDHKVTLNKCTMIYLC